MKKQNLYLKRILSMLLCLSFVLLNVASISVSSAVDGQNSAVDWRTSGTTGHESDINNMYAYLDVMGLVNSSQYAGRIWADKSVFTEGIDLQSVLDGYKGRININSDFLVAFSALASSQKITEYSPVDLVLALDISGSMGSPMADEGVRFINYGKDPELDQLGYYEWDREFDFDVNIDGVLDSIFEGTDWVTRNLWQNDVPALQPSDISGKFVVRADAKNANENIKNNIFVATQIKNAVKLNILNKYAGVLSDGNNQVVKSTLDTAGKAWDTQIAGYSQTHASMFRYWLRSDGNTRYLIDVQYLGEELGWRVTRAILPTEFKGTWDDLNKIVKFGAVYGDDGTLTAEIAIDKAAFGITGDFQMYVTYSDNPLPDGVTENSAGFFGDKGDTKYYQALHIVSENAETADGRIVYYSGHDNTKPYVSFSSKNLCGTDITRVSVIPDHVHATQYGSFVLGQLSVEYVSNYNEYLKACNEFIGNWWFWRDSLVNNPNNLDYAHGGLALEAIYDYLQTAITDKDSTYNAQFRTYKTNKNWQQALDYEVTYAAKDADGNLVKDADGNTVYTKIAMKDALNALYDCYQQNYDALAADMVNDDLTSPVWPIKSWDTWMLWTGLPKHPMMNTTPNRMYYLIDAANRFIENFMALTDDNRVAVVAYDSSAYVVLPLDHYQKDGDTPYLTATKHHWQADYNQWASTLWVNAVSTTGNGVIHYSATSWTNTNIMGALNAALSELSVVKDPVVKSAKVTRRPVVVMMTDGSANTILTDSWTNVEPTVASGGNGTLGEQHNDSDNPGLGYIDGSKGADKTWSGTKRDYTDVVGAEGLVDETSAPKVYGDNRDKADGATMYAHEYLGDGNTLIAFHTLMTTAYLKQVVQNNYVNEDVEGDAGVEPEIYTIGYDVEDYTGNVLEASRVNVNPLDNLDDANNSVANSVRTNFATLRQNSTLTLTSGNVSLTYNVSDLRNGITIDQIEKNLKYNTEYFLASSYDTSGGFSIGEIFDMIEKRIGGVSFTPIGGENGAGLSDSLIYMDPIGKYMEVKGVQSLLLFGELYKIERYAVYSYEFNLAYRYAHDNIGFNEFPVGWYDGDDGSTAEYLGSDVPSDCADEAAAWEKGYVYRVNYSIAHNFVATLKEASTPEEMSDRAQNTVYTLFKYASGENGVVDGDKIITNPCYDHEEKTFHLNAVHVWVEDSGDYVNPQLGLSDVQIDQGYDEALYVNIPVDALPVQVVGIEANNDGTFSYSTNLGRDNDSAYDAGGHRAEEKELRESGRTDWYNDMPIWEPDQGALAYYQQSTPLRVFYDVGIADEVMLPDGSGVDLGKISQEYIYANRKGSKVYFYSNYYTPANLYSGYAGELLSYDHGDAVVSASPSPTNRYYIFQKNLTVYKVPNYEEHAELWEVVKDSNGESLTDAEGKKQYRPKDFYAKPGKNGEMYLLVPKADGTLEELKMPIADEITTNDYYYIVTDFYTRQDNQAIETYYATARTGSMLSSKISEDGVGDGAFLNWYCTHCGKTSPSQMNEAGNALVTPATCPACGQSAKDHGNYVTMIGGVRTGNMAQNVRNKLENKTETSATRYVPTISSASDRDHVFFNLYLGNNGRLHVNDCAFLVTKQVNTVGEGVDLTDMKFKFTLKIQAPVYDEDGNPKKPDSESDPYWHDRTFSAIHVEYSDDFGWHSELSAVDLKTNNEGLLYANGGLSLATVPVDEDGKIPEIGYVDGKLAFMRDDTKKYTEYYVYIIGRNVGKNTVRIYDNKTATDHARTLYIDEAYLIPMNWYEPGWSFSRLEEEKKADLIKLNAENKNQLLGAQTNRDYLVRMALDSVFLCDATYVSETITFDSNGVATFYLKHNEGVLFTGLDENTHFIVDEIATDETIAAKAMLQQINIFEYDHVQESDRNEITNSTTLRADYDAAAYPDTDNMKYGPIRSVDRYTSTLRREAHYINYVPDIEKIEDVPGAGKYVDIGDVIEYRIKWENFSIDEEGKPKAATVTVTDPLDNGVDFLEAGFVEGTAGDSPTFGEPIDNLYNRETHTVTWTIEAEPGQIGYVWLKVKVNESALEYWNDYVENADHRNVDYEVLNRAGVKVGNYPEVHTDIVKNPTGGPHKNLAEREEGDAVTAGDKVKYVISYVNYTDEDANVIINDPLDDGVDFVSAKFGEVELNAAYFEDGEDEIIRAEGDGVTISYDKVNHIITWEIKDVASKSNGEVSLTVAVNDSAKNGELINNQARVKIGNQPEQETEVSKVKVSDFGDLTITKRIVNTELVDETREFTFTVTLKGALTEWVDEDENVWTLNEDGVWVTTVTLKHGESITIEHIPEETEFTVSEGDHPGYSIQSVSVTMDGEPVDNAVTKRVASGVVTAGTVIEVLFCNTPLLSFPGMGGMGSFVVYALGGILLLLGLAGYIALSMSRRRRRFI